MLRILLLIGGLSAAPARGQAQARSGAIATHIRLRIEMMQHSTAASTAGSEVLFAQQTLPRFYVERHFVPAGVDLLFTDAFMLFGSHLLRRRVNPETLDANWSIERWTADFAAVLEQALAEGSIRPALMQLAPPPPASGL